MQVTRSSFSHELLSRLSLKNKIHNPLVNCLELISKKMGLSIPFDKIEELSLVRLDNFDNYSRRFGIMLSKVNTISIDELSSSLFPLLVQEKSTDKLFVILKCNRSGLLLYDAMGDCYVTKNHSDFEINYLWQCCQIGFIPKSTFFGLIRFVLNHFYENTWLALILGGFAGLSGLLISVLSGYVFSHLHEARQASYTIFFYAFFFLFAGVGLLSGLSELYAKVINAKVVNFIMPSVISRLMNLSLKMMNQFTTGEVNQRVSDYELAISTVITNCFSVVFSITILVVLMGYLLYCNPALALIYLLISVLSLGLKLLLIPKNVAHISKALDQQGKVASLLNEIFLQINKIRSSHSETNVFQRWLKSMIYAKFHVEQSKKIEIALVLLETVLPVILLIFFYYKVYLSTDELLAYFVLRFMVCAGQFLGAFDRLSINIITLIHLFPSLKRLDPLFEDTPVNNHHPISFDFNGHIHLDNVSYRAEDQEDFILKNISIDIKSGQFIAIIGESGSGKSTLLKLLLGFESTVSGNILYDDKNIDDIDMQQLRKKFGVVLQSSSLFSGTIYSNIAMNTELTTDEVWQLIECVGLGEDVNNMPMKIHTYVSDNPGESLSGGQCQKILIARALAANPKILILDEATSALDSNSQESIYRNLNKMGITKIVVAHRLSTIRDADMIYVLKKGELIDQGTYEELQEKGRLG